MEFADTNQQFSEETLSLNSELETSLTNSSTTNRQQLNNYEQQALEESLSFFNETTSETTIPEIEGIIVMGDVTGDGGVDLDDVDQLLRDRRQALSGPEDPRDINGDGRLSLLDVQELGLQVRNNTDQTSPELAANLINDTGGLNNDGITRDPLIGGSLTDDNLITRFLAGFNETSLENYRDIRGVLEADGTFSLDETQLAEINGNNPLSDGEYNLSFFTKDQWNNQTTFELNFTLDRQLPEITLESPLEGSQVGAGDHLTGNSNGTGSDIASFSYQIDSGVAIPIIIDNNGDFAFSKIQNSLSPLLVLMWRVVFSMAAFLRVSIFATGLFSVLEILLMRLNPIIVMEPVRD
jgi:hypothetical protein